MLTFREFYEICEAKRPDTPPHAVPGTYKRDSEGNISYTLQSYDGPLGKPTKKEVNKLIVKHSGGNLVKKSLKKAEKIERIGEDVEELRRGLETLERKSAPRQKLEARRRAALERTKQIHKTEKNRQKRYQEQQAELRRQKEQNENLQLEQTPHMNPTPFNVMKAKEQAKGGIKHRIHVHQEIGAEARRQETAHQRRLAKLTRTP